MGSSSVGKCMHTSPAHSNEENKLRICNLPVILCNITLDIYSVKLVSSITATNNMIPYKETDKPLSPS